MALSANYGGDPHAPDGPSTAGQRLRARMQGARRHTRAVRVLRAALPAAFVVMIAGFSMAVMKTSGLGSGLPQLKIPKILPENLAMANPHYEGFGKDGSSYTVAAKSARQNFDNTNIINLSDISGTLTDLDKAKTNFTAVRGDYNQKTAVLELFEKITVHGETGLRAELKSATLNTKDNTMVSKEPVNVGFTAGTITANSLKLRNKAHEATFTGDVVAQFVPPKPDVTGPDPTKMPADPTQMFAASGAPLDITSNRLDVQDAQNTAIFTGNVKAVQAGQSLTSPELTVIYARDGAADDKNEPPAPGVPAGKIQRIAAKGPVVLGRGTLDQVTANALEFNAKTNIASLIGGVVMQSGTDRNAKSDRADMNQTDGTILLTGSQVDVLQGRNELHGRRMLINRTTGNSQLTSPPAAGAGPGRIQAKFYSGSGDAKKGKTLAPADDTGSSPMASFKSDPSKPIDIDAEQLDVNNGAKTATFRGDVIALQGDITFKTSEMIAHYTGDINIADATEPAKKSKNAKSETELTHIEAKKNVTVLSKDGQSVQGDWATFDAKANTVVVGGEVILSKGGSMVRGSRMNIDLTTGENTIETSPAQTVQVPGGGGWTTTAPEAGSAASGMVRGRPSAVFFPGDMQGTKDKKDKKSEPKAVPQSTEPATGDAWTAQTAPAASGPVSNPLQSPN
jgi:LPS export ABC transporter protein LptC